MEPLEGKPHYCLILRRGPSLVIEGADGVEQHYRRLVIDS